MRLKLEKNLIPNIFTKTLKRQNKSGGIHIHIEKSKICLCFLKGLMGGGVRD